MPDPIKAIVRTFISSRDLNGNCYHLAQVFSVRRGIYQFITIEAGGESNVGSMVGRILGEHGTVFTTSETIPKRAWQAKRRSGTVLYEHEAETALREFFGKGK